MARHRAERVADRVREIVSDRIANHSSDPRLAGVRITEVRLSPDLREARLWFSVYPGGEPERAAALAGLEHARGWLRREVAKLGGLRVTPTLHFLADPTLERAAHIDEVLRCVLPPEPPDGEA